MKTLVIVSHPYPNQSTVIQALQNAVQDLKDVTVRNLESLYGNKTESINIQAEQDACNDMDRIVFLYPTHWFNLTPMLKAYLNQVWTYGWAFGPGGEALKGKELLVVTSAGASEFTYSHEGLIKSSMEEVLTPLKASALYVGMKYVQPIAFFEVASADQEKINRFQKTLSDRLAA
ncbi:NAD(P)H-dependent oxidoreductase [Escherichia coli]|jgi:glutathione-regulated potassium-efflux system ancillary protein KefF|uniref:NAD(P)H-dependent oxidoreductase n=1 Tax=Enterobacteriaceae TaxID=543 RepID=UPI000887EDBF|nr:MULTISPECIES: NAD(P)H-dependent oxidoreductase [Enterobacteriaceae]EAX7332251.1 NAD(P)H-dependent oxidoreductase [Salmonella enterica]EBB9035465.1 NAD(P)H-dependent oxidoreductase [Salmonella enterica subsp. enterica serovar Oslo]EBR0641890.1 NAD(P)H-dependent oxidoreductase [Salmonella enterica]ECF8483039.1 NAD(P)H-dependent oxidoreductase [Salmonella enterica]EDS7870820.1 NAD(P)H-dependent oxidoreductase [Salmonella enterica subsp. enterica serovar Oslo]